jgi:hypothetical protein
VAEGDLTLELGISYTGKFFVVQAQVVDPFNLPGFLAPTPFLL